MTQILACPCKTAQILLDINWCSVANILKAAVTDLVLLLGIPITLVNLQKAQTRIKRAGKKSLEEDYHQKEQVKYPHL
jgi:uncharacterized membrane protein YccF (DUF307 family)